MQPVHSATPGTSTGEDDEHYASRFGAMGKGPLQPYPLGRYDKQTILMRVFMYHQSAPKWKAPGLQSNYFIVQ